MTYHWHDDEFDWCPCDEEPEGIPIRVRTRTTARQRRAERRAVETEPKDKAS